MGEADDNPDQAEACPALEGAVGAKSPTLATVV